MTTPAHIQELTDAIKANHPSVTFHDAYDIATLAFSMSAEICAEVCENWSDAQHIAHDMRTGVFPKQTKVWNAIACRIRALIPKEG